MFLPLTFRRFVLLGFLLLLTACSTAAETPTAVPATPPPLPTTTATPTAVPPTATTPPTVEPTATSEPTPTTEPSPTPEPLPPAADALEQLLRDVEAGRYTLEEGLIQALEAMVTGGELPLDPTQPPVESHLTGLVRHAEYYVETGEDEATKTQLTELLNQLFPTEADLDAVSTLETSGRVSGGLAAVIPNGCSVEGQCLVYRERVIEGNRFKIYYPAVAGPRSGTWWVDKLDAAVDAVDYTVNYYNRLGRGNMRGVTILFRPDGDAHLNTTDYAFTRYTVVPAGQACPIIINPKITTITPEQFQQVLAHELFHCYQFTTGHI